MKFIHLADLHIGKRYNETSLIEDQKYVLSQILKITEEEKPCGVIIAGDVYDKSVPATEGIGLFDRFLNSLADMRVNVFIISGNHDSAERLAFGAKLMQRGGVYTSPVYDGTVKPIVLEDEFGKLNVYLLPFIKPALVRHIFEGKNIESYTDAVKAAVRAMNINPAERNVLVAHQFVTGSESAGSEEFSVGDLGNVDAAVFEGFDYVALGHIHRAQNIGSERVRYCGTPLKYSLSEASDQKTVTIVELNGKGSLSVRTAALNPLRDVVEIRGTYERLTDKRFYEGTTLGTDLVHIVLTDESEIPDALGKLRIIYPNVMSLKYDNKRTREDMSETEIQAELKKSPIEMFGSLFEKQNNRPMSGEQEEVVREIIDKLWGEE